MTKRERLFDRMCRDADRYAKAREAFVEAELLLVKAKSSFRRSRQLFNQAMAKEREKRKR